MFHIYRYVERAIKVEREFIFDRQYVVRDGEIVIVDEFTGRLSEGRKWRDGIHQAVEAKQGVEVTVATGQAARITVQDFFLRYERLAGMTGTAKSSAGELRKIYKVHVVIVPTNRPVIRQRLADLVFGTDEEKWQAIADEVAAMHEQGRPVLIGTRSIDKSEHLSKLLAERDIEHQILNANHIAAEAEIVARAGLTGKVTVSTNMAGRGTDIKLGEGVKELGGLHVVCTRDARLGPHRLAAPRPLRPPGRPGKLAPVPGAGRRAPGDRAGPQEGTAVRGPGRSIRRLLQPPQRPLPPFPAQSRAASLPRPPRPDVLREATQEDAAADGPGRVPRYARVSSRRWKHAGCPQ